MYLYLVLAKAKLESQLELVRTQEALNGTQSIDISKRVIDFLLNICGFLKILLWFSISLEYNLK